jgi:NAD(P)-dependent dehydrogenase (short-subunit alcohol dehydrogenase family)
VSRVVLVTGAGSGIGRATAVRFGTDGERVACLDVATEGCEKTAADIGESARPYTCDVSDLESVRSTVARVVDDLGPPRVVCNIAGIGTFAHSAEQPKEEWDRILAVNLTGTFLMCQVCLPHLLEGGGVILNTASSAGLFAQPYSAAYCASKGGVVLLTKALAYEFIDRGVRVNAVAPGQIDTAILGNFAFPEGTNRKLFYRLMSPMGFGSPEEVAGLFAYLASDEARFITGAVFSIDGGITA